MDFNEELDVEEESEDEVEEEEEEDEGDGGADRRARTSSASRSPRWTASARSAGTSPACSACLQKEGHKSPKYLDLQKKISGELMQIRFAARQVERLCDSVRSEVDNIRQIERKIQDLVVNKGGMPRPDFIKKFPDNETSLRWIDREIAARHPYSEQLAQVPPGHRRAAAEAPRPAEAGDDSA